MLELCEEVTVVNPGAKLREGTSAGAFCKLGGEIEGDRFLAPV